MTATSTPAGPRRRVHVLGDQVERLFGRGQAAFREHAHQRAIELLEQASELDPGYARIRCWLAMAQAEAGRVDDADATFAEAIALRADRDELPRRSQAVFPLERGLAWLDAGHPERARTHLGPARGDAPDNRLIQASLALCAWDADDQRDPAALLADIELFPGRHQARVLVRLSRQADDTERPSARPAAEPSDRAFGRWQRARERRRSERLLARAERLLAKGAHRRCLDCLRDVQPVDAEQRRRQHELFADAARERVAGMRVLFDAKPPKGLERADALFRMARQLREAGEDGQAAELAREWLTEFEQLARPQQLVDDALDAWSFCAAQALQTGEPERAAQELEQAFALRAKGTGELHRLRAHAHVARGDERAARHDFEDWLADFPLNAEYALLASVP